MILKLYHLNPRQKEVLYQLEKDRMDDVILLETRLSPTDSQFDLLLSNGANPKELSCAIIDRLISLGQAEDALKLLSPNVKVNEGKLFSLVESQRESIHHACTGE